MPATRGLIWIGAGACLAKSAGLICTFGAAGPPQAEIRSATKTPRAAIFLSKSGHSFITRRSAALSGSRRPPWAGLLRAAHTHAITAAALSPKALENGQVQDLDRGRRPAADDECRYRHDHPEAVPEDHQADRSRQESVRRDALYARGQGNPGLRPQQAAVSAVEDPGDRRQFRLRLLARACA